MEMRTQLIRAVVSRARPGALPETSKLLWCALVFVFLVMPLLAPSQTYFSVQANPGSEAETERLSERAKRAIGARDWPQAATILEQLAQLAPSVPEIHANLGIAYYFQGRSAEALSSFQRALKLKPQMRQANVMVGICQAELGHSTEAIAILAPAFNKTTEAETRLLIGQHLQQAYSAVKQYDKAVAVGEELVKRYSNNPEVLFQVSRLYADRSYDLMSHLMRSDPDSVWAHYANAQVQESLARYDIAKREYEHIVKREPKMPGVHYRLGRL